MPAVTRAARLSADTATRVEPRAALVAVLVPIAVVALTAAQGGYFPTSWGWSASLLLWGVALWSVVSGRTEAQRGDLAFAGLLTLFACWVGLSLAWSDVPAQTVLDLERMLVLVSGTTAFLLVARRCDAPLLLGVVLATMTAVAAYALATRLLPDRLGSYDPIAGYRLSDPVGYWNGLGIYCAMAIALAAGGIVHGRRPAARAAAAAALPLLTTTLYFTYSRGAWLALGLGLLVVVAVSPRRLAIVTSLLLAGIPTAAVVWLASGERALTHQELELDRAVAQGRRVLVFVVGACLVAAALQVGADRIARRTTIAPALRRAYGGALLAVAAVAIVAVLVGLGGPVTMADRAWNAFAAAPPQPTNLNDRLFNLSSNGRVELWRAAGSLYAENPVLGSGAGTFERYWQSRADAAFKVRDAHGLYVETLAELGPFGLILLCCALSIPIVAGLRRRSSAVAPAALGAYVAYCVHAGLDWDWELSGVTLTALVVGSLLIVAGRRDGGAAAMRVVPRTAIGACAIAASIAALAGLIGNSALARAQDAIDRDDRTEAVHQADRARRLMPWSPWPWIVRGEAALRGRAFGDAAADFRHATDIDPGEWRAWLYLGMSTSGAEQLRALHRAAALYPQDSEARDALRAARERSSARR